MQQIEISKLSSSILLLLGEKMLETSFLDKGATCSIWKVKSNQNTYALRIVDADERVICGTVDSFLRKEISARGGSIADPVLHSEASEPVLSKKRWSLDEYIIGEHPGHGKLSFEICHNFGKTLAALHDLPVLQCGRPHKIVNSVIVGEKCNILDGVMQRFENPMPETWEPGFTHPVFAKKPILAPKVIALLKQVSNTLKTKNHVLCHTDLHARQLLCLRERLVALIDFGGASILNPNWDLGSALYFHGMDNFQKIHSSYIKHLETSSHETELVKAFSIAVAMHHASRSRLPGKEHRLERAISHITDIIDG